MTGNSGINALWDTHWHALFSFIVKHKPHGKSPQYIFFRYKSCELISHFCYHATWYGCLFQRLDRNHAQKNRRNKGRLYNFGDRIQAESLLNFQTIDNHAEFSNLDANADVSSTNKFGESLFWDFITFNKRPWEKHALFTSFFIYNLIAPALILKKCVSDCVENMRN